MKHDKILYYGVLFLDKGGSVYQNFGLGLHQFHLELIIVEAYQIILYAQRIIIWESNS